MSLTYDTWVSQLANLMVVSSADANFQIFLPGCRDYAEQRLYRELDPLYAQVTDSTASVSSGVRTFTPPTTYGSFITVDSINIMTPVGTTASNGTRSPLVPVSPEVIDALYPSGQTATGVPAYYAMRSPTQIILGPAPDAAYGTEVIGVQRPTPLSSANSSTFLTTYCPDVFMAASMVFASGYMRDFGAQADNPQMGASWEAQYKLLVASAGMEQARAKWTADGWTSQPPAPAGPRK